MTRLVIAVSPTAMLISCVRWRAMKHSAYDTLTRAVAVQM